MNATHALIMSHGFLLAALLALLVFTRTCWRRSQSVAVQSASRLRQLQSLRDALHGWLVDGTPSDMDGLRRAVEHTTGLHSGWLGCESATVTEAQLALLPFSAEPHLANMALQTRKTVHQHQLAQWGWASTYIPVFSPGQPPALLLLTSPSPLSADDHAFAAAGAEILCNAWSHATHMASSPAITSA